MKDKLLFSDEELTAYLDGESDYARMDEINKALAQDSLLRTRIEQLSLSREALKSAFDELLQQAPEVEVDNSVAPPRAFQRRPYIAAAMFFVAVVGFMFGWGGHHYSEPAMGWKGYVAAYQALYSPSTLAHIDTDDKGLSKELERVSRVLGRSFSLKILQANEALDYKRAQVLGFDGQPLVQLAFVSSMKTPIALCIIRLDKAPSDGIQTMVLEGMSAASWEKAGYGFLLIGGKDEHLIRESARQFANYL